MTTTVEFDTWQTDAPVVALGNPEFDAWLNDAPDADSSGPTTTPPPRRRAVIF